MAPLGCSDQTVLVTDGEPDTASLVCEAAERLKHGPSPRLLVVNQLDTSSRLDIAAPERTIAFARDLVAVPHDCRGAEQLPASRVLVAPGARPPAGACSVRGLAALLAADWSQLEPSPRTTASRHSQIAR